jgi:hypothetical protein
MESASDTIWESLRRLDASVTLPRTRAGTTSVPLRRRRPTRSSNRRGRPQEVRGLVHRVHPGEGGTSDEEFQKSVREKLLGMMTDSGQKQKVIPVSKLKAHISQGWEYVTQLPDSEAVFKPPS